MKLVFKKINYHDGSGEVGLIAESSEDLWHAYNLLFKGDCLRSTASRKVKTEVGTSTVSKRVKTNLTIAIETIDFDTESCSLHVKGRNVEKNKFVSMGDYHTLDLELNQKFTIKKNCWDKVHLYRIKQACELAKQSDVAAVVMQEGLAHVCLVLPSMTMMKSKVQVSIPAKRRGHNDKHEKGMKNFFNLLMKAIESNINFDVVKVVVLASPGFVNENFYDYMFSEAVKRQTKVLTDNKNKFVKVQSATGYIHSLNDALTDPSIASRVADTKVMEELNAINELKRLMRDNPDKTCYGLKHIIKAHEEGAIKTLLITDNMIRSQDVAQRKEMVKLLNEVKSIGGTTKMFSAMHSTGQELSDMTGIAAILRFPIVDNHYEDSDEDSSGDEEFCGPLDF